MRDDARNWVALADYDIETASHMLKTGRYLYVVFLCHLALEKMLKAHVTEVTQEFPAKTHDLISLVKKCGLELPQDLLEFIGKINTASIPTRYPEDLQRAIQEYPKPVAKEYLKQTRKVMKWLKERFEVS
ncbi:MAG: HEPN domain-containing protein [Anaerolineales bacterium]|nr:HEPN domain-containing protein [Anaerolineales bacterium]